MEPIGDFRLSDRRMTEWFLREKALREWERAGDAPVPARQAVITLARQFGAGGHTVAARVATALGADWQVWDREIVEAVAHHADVEAAMVAALDERTRSRIDEAVSLSLGIRTLETAHYQRCLARAVLAVAQQGRKILLGRGANFLLPDALHVRLHAPHDFRVHEAMRREGLSQEEAERRVRQVDRERSSFIHSHYHQDVDAPRHYDVILQTGRLSAEEAAAIIVAAAHARWREGV